MIVSVAMITVKPGHQGPVADILNEHVNQEKKAPGCVKAYYKKAINSDDTFLVYVEYDNMQSFQMTEKEAEKKKEEGKVEFVLRPHILKAFFGNFD